MVILLTNNNYSISLEREKSKLDNQEAEQTIEQPYKQRTSHFPTKLEKTKAKSQILCPKTGKPVVYAECLKCQNKMILENEPVAGRTLSTVVCRWEPTNK
jgi:hypothetical protein